MRASPAKKDDHIEFFAEIDLLCALSTCLGGDLSVPLWGRAGPDIEVQALDPKLLDGWKPPESPAYKGAHGMRLVG
jgi:uncharacterized protein YcgI (DUF1989 family)